MTRLPGFAVNVAILCLLAFIAGAASQYYAWPLTRPLTGALEGGKAWLESQPDSEEAASQLAPADTVNAALAEGRVTIHTADAYPSYTLINLHYLNSSFLLDMNGKVVHRWNMPFGKAWSTAPQIRVSPQRAATNIRSSQLFANGDLLVVYEALRDSPYGYGIAKIDKDSRVLWTYNGNAHHDIYVDADNGQIYTLTQRYLKQPIQGLEALPFPLLEDYVTILSPEGQELASISLLEAFRQTPFEPMLFQGKKEEFPRWDHLHSNSVSALPATMAAQFPQFKPGFILVSIRNLNTVAVIDPDTRKVVWAYNGLWQAQHSAAFMDNGHIVVFDNLGQVDQRDKSQAEERFSRIIEFDPATYRVAWHYTGSRQQPFYSFVYGRVQPLPNGRFFVTETLSNRLFELDRNGAIAWEYRLPEVYKKKRTENDPKKPDLLTSIISAVKYDAAAVAFLATSQPPERK